MEEAIRRGEKFELNRTNEYASAIIESAVTDVPYRFNGNVRNHGLITNLPEYSYTEVPCVADAEGINPCWVGDLPQQCAAMCRTNISVQELAVKSILEKDKQTAFQAIALDPSVGAVLNLEGVRKLFEELWEREGDLLAAY
jgi:alpha-galactosidase